jgi:pilus assembly protein CpaB
MFFRNFLLALGAVFVVAGLALSVVWLRQVGTEPVAPSGPSAERAVEEPAPSGQAVLAAKGAIPAGTLLRPSDMSWKPVNADDVRPGHLVKGQIGETDLAGGITRRDFADGEALIAGELVLPGDRNFLAAALRPGSRAVSISVDAPQIASGLILPGDRVDVILTQNLGDGAGGDPKRKSVGETVLRNLRVVAVGQSLSGQTKTPEVLQAPGPATADAVVPKTVTLEVNEREAETLFVATQLGGLQLAVRPLVGTGEMAAELQRAAPTWASDVSPALNEIKVRAAKEASGSTIESSIRRPPAKEF